MYKRMPMGCDFGGGGGDHFFYCVYLQTTAHHIKQQSLSIGLYRLSCTTIDVGTVDGFQVGACAL